MTELLAKFDRAYLTRYEYVCGIDEAGRGPLAGPVACAAVIMPLGAEDIIDGVNDSKKLTEKTRERLFEIIAERALQYSVELIPHGEIDRINILNATKAGMLSCHREIIRNFEDGKKTVFLIDAVKLPIDCSEAIIGGDAKSYSVACASILAKVVRDRLMRSYDAEFPGYGFAKHKGYGTAAHYKAIDELGLCPIHRKSFLKGLF